MSFFKKLTDMVLSGKVPTLDSVTDLAKDSLDPSMAKRLISDAMLSPLQKQVSAMQWDWRNGSQSWNKGTGNCVRNWDQEAKEDLILAWKPVAGVAEYVMVLGWSGWASGMIQRGGEHFTPEFIDALMADKLATVRIARFKAEIAPLNAVRMPVAGFYYLKLLGVTSDGTYVEIADYSLATAASRASGKDIPPAPEGELPFIEIPEGTASASDFERGFKQKK